MICQGAVLNEIRTNAIKQGFADDRPGTLRVSVKLNGQTARISIEDDGPGLTDRIPGPGGLGTTLIRRLSRQVGATVAWKVQIQARA